MDKRQPESLTTEEMEERLDRAEAVEITLTWDAPPFGRYEENWELRPDGSWHLATSGTYND